MDKKQALYIAQKALAVYSAKLERKARETKDSLQVETFHARSRDCETAYGILDDIIDFLRGER